MSIKIKDFITELATVAPLVLCLFIVFGVCGVDGCSSYEDKGTTKVFKEVDFPQMEQISYIEDIQPIFNKRCVVCHSCYDAPAQLNLSCADGVLRGATKKVVYDALRLKPIQPTRLHIDAQTVEGWRKLGFYSVLGDRNSKSVTERLKTSLIYQMTSLARLNRLPYNTKIAKLQRNSHDPAIAPTIDEFPDYMRKYPHAGMPFFTQRLTDKEFATISNWIAQGSHVERKVVKLTKLEKQSVDKWESMLNGDSLKSQLIARYLYEHLFISHLYFSDIPNSGYFKIVRSKTPPGEKLVLITTALANDNPGVKRVYYRLKKIDGIIKRKTHIVYALGAKKFKRIKELFFETEWDIDKLPDYSDSVKVNPFITFSAIPAKSRYQFMLDDSYYFTQSFIRGPVCRGQNALNAINDQFYIMFQSPNSILSMTDDSFLRANMKHMTLPGNIRSLIAFPVSFGIITSERNDYLNNRTDYLNKYYLNGKSVSLDDIWDGDSGKSDPTLTVFRHFDTASLMSGFVGDQPESAWVIDFPLFERIYYSLVVNYDIFSTAGLQAATRRYFDLLRHEAENNFLLYLPIQFRQKLQDEWYRGVLLKGLIDYHKPSTTIKSALKFKTDNIAKEFTDSLMRVDKSIRKGKVDKQLEDFSKTIPAKLAPVVQFLPELVLIRVKMNNGNDQVYTMIRNKAHKNVAYIFDEQSRREPEKDTVMFIKGITGDYPNMILTVSEDELDTFKSLFYAADSADKIEAMLIKYGVLRNSNKFWQNVDWFQTYIKPSDHRDYGIFDLKNYYTY